MATRITVLKNPNGQFKGWMCKHSGTSHNAECDGHVVLCERCSSAVKNGAELLDEKTQLVEPIKVSAVPVVKRAAAAAAGR